jgi:hypothetical protein
MTSLLKLGYRKARAGASSALQAVKEVSRPVALQSRGVCPICSHRVRFIARNSWLRDHFLCPKCKSIPRERALMVVIERCFPQWRQMIIHESSPCGRGASVRLANEAAQYVPSQYFQNSNPGEMVLGFRNENLESLSFADESIGLHVSQDVFEHVFNPVFAFKEIARTLEPGGAHVFTVPLVRKGESSRRRATLNEDGRITHHLPPQFHGNPIDDSGALVTIDWGYDICEKIALSCGLHTEIHHINDLSQCIRAEFIEVLVTRKPHSTSVRSEGLHDEI